MRNMLATLLLSQGTPMVCAGDEFAPHAAGQQQRLLPGQRDQLGRLGASPTTSRTQIAFFRRLTELFHRYPMLRRSRFFIGEVNPDLDVKDVTWIDANGSEMTPETWDNDLTRCFGMLLDGRAQATGIKRRGDDATLLIVFNAHHDVVEFTLPQCCGRARLESPDRHQRPRSARAGIRDRRMSTK